MTVKCDYCGNAWHDNRRGGCNNCGGKPPEKFEVIKGSKIVNDIAEIHAASLETAFKEIELYEQGVLVADEPSPFPFFEILEWTVIIGVMILSFILILKP